MAKGSKIRKSSNKNPKDSLSHLSDSDMDDEIDIFHKQRDVVPLDLDDDIGESDEDNEHHVFPIEDGSDDEDEDEDDSDDDTELTGFAAKIAKQQRSLKAKIGGAADETQDDAEDDEKKTVAWGRSKNIYYDTNKGESSDDELLDEEEAEVLRLQKEKTEAYSNADHGLDDDDGDESEGEPTFEEKLGKAKARSKATASHTAQEETDTTYEVVVKDPSSLSREEQMDIVYNSAPELVGLLSELNDAVEQLETKVDPILNKAKEAKILNETGVQYMELKKQLLLSYCQAIIFHLLLKSEGLSVRDHPVLARIMEVKNLLDKMKQLDEDLSFDFEDIMKKNSSTTLVNFSDSTTAVEPNSLTDILKNTTISSVTQREVSILPPVETEPMKVDSVMDLENRRKHKCQNEQPGLQSVEMLKVRAALEEKLKQKGLYNLKAPKPNGVKKNRRPLNGKLEALDDFDDDADDIDGSGDKMRNGHVNIPSSRLSQLVTPKMKKAKVISGDDDLPKRDDIGERRRKHEMRVLASAGIKSDDEMQDDEPGTLEPDRVDEMNEEDNTDSEPDLYEEIKEKRDAKLAVKAQKHSRNAPSVPVEPETPLDGKRHINYEMEKNRGLTRKRNKVIKNPRKKYKLKHKKKEVARKGQVRDIKKPSGPYGGEGSGINTISRSIRFKS